MRGLTSSAAFTTTNYPTCSAPAAPLLPPALPLPPRLPPAPRPKSPPSSLTASGGTVMRVLGSWVKCARNSVLPDLSPFSGLSVTPWHLRPYASMPAVMRCTTAACTCVCWLCLTATVAGSGVQPRQHHCCVQCPSQHSHMHASACQHCIHYPQHNTPTPYLWVFDQATRTHLCPACLKLGLYQHHQLHAWSHHRC